MPTRRFGVCAIGVPNGTVGATGIGMGDAWAFCRIERCPKTEHPTVQLLNTPIKFLIPVKLLWSIVTTPVMVTAAIGTTTRG